jgi:hypothetical protein
VTLLAEIALIAAAAIGVAICLAVLPPAAPSRSKRPAPPSPSRPEQLVRVERLVASAGVSALHVHAYLRPLLVEVTTTRLASRGQSLAQMPATLGRELLGDRLWEIVRPGRPFPEDRYAPGITLQELSAIVDTLEQL